MFKENWPLTGLVKLLNPAGGRQLGLIRQGGELQSCKPSALGCWLGGLGVRHVSQDANGEGRFGGGWSMMSGSRKQDVGRPTADGGRGRLSTGKSDRLISDVAEKHETKGAPFSHPSSYKKQP